MYLILEKRKSFYFVHAFFLDLMLGKYVPKWLRGTG